MAEAQVEICLLWGDWQIQQWWSCMTKAEWAGWMQFIGAITAVAVAFSIARYQFVIERRRDKRLAESLIVPFAGALHAVKEKLPPNGTRSFWDMRLTRMLLESELKRSDSVPLHALTSSSHYGLYAYRLIAMQLIEAFKIAEATTENVTDPRPESYIRVRGDAYQFVQESIQRCEAGIQEANSYISREFSAR